MNGFGPRRIRLKRWLRLSRRHCRADRPRGLSGRAVIGYGSGLNPRLIPRTVIDNQHAQYAECCDCDCHRERRAAVPIRMIPGRMIICHRLSLCHRSSLFRQSPSENQARLARKVPYPVKRVCSAQAELVSGSCISSTGRCPPFKTAPVADSQRSLTHYSERAHARIAKGDGPRLICLRRCRSRRSDQ